MNDNPAIEAMARAGEQVMRVNLANFLKQAAACIDPEKDDFGYEWFLREEIPRLISEVRNGSATVQEFAEMFCIAPEEPRL